jgi:hypothetical protein
MICPTGKVEKIYGQDWTGRIRLKRFNKSGFWRSRFSRITARQLRYTPRYAVITAGLA